MSSRERLKEVGLKKLKGDTTGSANDPHFPGLTTREVMLIKAYHQAGYDHVDYNGKSYLNPNALVVEEESVNHPYILDSQGHALSRRAVKELFKNRDTEVDFRVRMEENVEPVTLKMSANQFIKTLVSNINEALKLALENEGRTALPINPEMHKMIDVGSAIELILSGENKAGEKIIPEKLVILREKLKEIVTPTPPSNTPSP